MKRPHLIQRATVKGFEPDYKVSDYLNLDYMGSAEFEFGAVPKSLRAFHAKINELFVYPHNGSHLKILCTTVEVAEYSKLLNEVLSGELRLKEYCSFVDMLNLGRRDRSYYKDDFWFDVENAVALSFDIQALERFKLAVVNSVNFMDAQKKKGA